VDGIALASVITSGIVGLGGLGTGIWSTRAAARVAREGRVVERRIDAYLEILRLVEHQSLWDEHRVEVAAEAGDVFAPTRTGPRAPDPGERATISALLAAYGSTRLKEACATWLEARIEMDRAVEVAAFNWEESYYGPETPTGDDDLARLRSQVVRVGGLRQAVEMVVAEEIADA
jgi:hypothetical protein